MPPVVANPADFSQADPSQIATALSIVEDAWLQSLHIGRPQFQNQLRSVAVAYSGAPSSSFVRSFRSSLDRLGWGTGARIAITTQAEAAMNGLDYADGPVVGAVSAGIGCSVAVKVGCGRVVFEGGYLPGIDDAGGAYSIAARALQGIAEEVSGGTRVSTRLKEALRSDARGNSDADLLEWARYQPVGMSTRSISQLAQIIDQVAREGDDDAIRILSFAADDIVGHFNRLWLTLAPADRESISRKPIVCVGGVLRGSETVRTRVMTRLRNDFGVEVVIGHKAVFEGLDKVATQGLA